MRQIEAPWVGGPPDPDEHCNVLAPRDEEGDPDECGDYCTEDGEGCACRCDTGARARAAESDHDARDYDADIRLDAMRNGDMDEGEWW